MGSIDFCLILVVILSGVFALYRGLVRELLGLVAWILAVLGSFYGLFLVRPLVRQWIESPLLADITGVAILAVLILIVCTIINAKITTQLRKSALSGLDRMLGFLFGLLRGVLLVLAVYAFCVFALPHKVMKKYTQDNFLLSYLKMTIPTIEKLLPEDLLEGIGSFQKEQDVPYSKKDLDNMDALVRDLDFDILEQLEEEQVVQDIEEDTQHREKIKKTENTEEKISKEPQKEQSKQSKNIKLDKYNQKKLMRLKPVLIID